MPKNKFVPCPNCGRKGLHYMDHPDAFGYKDFERVECRFCHKQFRVVLEGGM